MWGIFERPNLFNNNEIDLRNLMFRVIEMDGQFTISFVLEHVWLVVTKSYFNFSQGGAYILQVAFGTSGHINNILWQTRQPLLNGILTTGCRTLKFSKLELNSFCINCTSCHIFNNLCLLLFDFYWRLLEILMATTSP